MSEHSALLELPAELRVYIFEYILEGCRSQRPLFVLDSVYVQSAARTPSRTTAILLACRSAYKECLPILYDHTAVELSVRDEDNTDHVQAAVINLGTIKDCRLLSRLRHVELEITFNTFDDASISRAADRIRRLSNIFNRHGKIKTLSLTFRQSGGHYRDYRTPCDVLVEQAMRIGCDKLIEVSCNMASRYAISTSKWAALRRLATNYIEAAPEEFHEISLDYWDRVFPDREQSSNSD